MMDELNLTLEKHLTTSKAALQLALDEVKKRDKIVNDLFENPRLLPEGLDDLTVEYILNLIAAMDSNNLANNVGVGEREGRVYSPLVSRRHFHLSHGIGRSGEITECQPKAIGSSLLYRMTNILVKHALHLAGLHKRTIDKCVVLPVATGMAISLCLAAFRRLIGFEMASKKKYVLLIRCDQKSALKAVTSSGFIPVMVENKLDGNDVVTDLAAVQETILRLQAENILCIVSTTSCFAPRMPDNVLGVGRLCDTFNIFHLVNNAYGVQSSTASKQISEAVLQNSRIDFVVQSTDKNFMVPVGGSVVFSPQTNGLIEQVEKSYPGRASASPIIDLFITLLQLGESGWRNILQERENNYRKSRTMLTQLLEPKGIKILSSPKNDISIALSTEFLPQNRHFGSELFLRKVSGVRFIDVVSKKVATTKEIDGVPHFCYGAHINSYPHSYLTIAVAVGTKTDDIAIFCNKLLTLL